MMVNELDGLTILVVEDDYLLAMEVKEVLESAGAEVVGPVGRIEPAREAMDRNPVHGAILDVKLDGHTSFPLVDDLLAREVPVILASGLEQAQLPERYQALPIVPKPIDVPALLRLAGTNFRRD